MTALLRFTGTAEHDPAIAQWFAARQDALGLLARAWFERMRHCAPGLLEVLHDGCPTVCVGDAGFAYVGAYRAHVNVGFFQGSSLPDPARLLQGTGKRMRHVKLRPGEEIDARALEALIAAAHADMVERVREEERGS